MTTIAESTETRIADGVLKVIADHGFDVVSVRTVAKACGLTGGTIQYHYPTRQDLLTAGLLRSLDRQQAEIARRSFENASFDTLLGVALQLLPLNDSLTEDATAWVSFVAAARSRPWLAEIVDEAISRLQQFFESLIDREEATIRTKDGIPADQAARLTTALINGLTMDILASPGNADLAARDLELGLSLIFERGQPET